MKPAVRVLLLFSLTALLVISPAGAQAPGLTLPQVLANMDDAARGFETAVADLTYTKVTIIVNDRSVEKGTIYFKRPKGKREIKVKIDLRDPSLKVVLFTDNKGQIYYPKAAQVEEYDLGKNRQAVEQFLLLGFGTPGRELQDAYDVTLAGDAKIDDVDAVKLELLPKSAGVARHIKKVELWLSRKTWQPVRQTFTEPSGDYLTAQYSSQKINAPIPDSQFKLNLPKNVKHIRPQSG